IESYQRYMPSSVLLRQLDRYVGRLRRIPQRRAQLDAALDGETSGPLYFQSLLLLRENPSIWAQIEASAQLDEDEIRQANRQPDNEDGVSSEPDWLDGIGQDVESDVDRVVSLLTLGQESLVVGSYIKWYRAVGGLTKPYGLLAGNLKGR